MRKNGWIEVAIGPSAPARVATATPAGDAGDADMTRIDIAALEAACEGQGVAQWKTIITRKAMPLT
jgi:hypothetical protein